jgi:hypothetical protein
MLVDLVVKQSLARLEHEIVIVLCVSDSFIQLGELGYRRRFDVFGSRGSSSAFRGLVGH